MHDRTAVLIYIQFASLVWGLSKISATTMGSQERTSKTGLWGPWCVLSLVERVPGPHNSALSYKQPLLFMIGLWGPITDFSTDLGGQYVVHEGINKKTGMKIRGFFSLQST